MSNIQPDAVGTDVEYLKSLYNKFTATIKTIPFKELYQIVLTFGGLWLFAFFISIERLPDFDITTAITLILSIAIGGAFISLLLCGYFLLPSFFLRNIWEQFNHSDKSTTDFKITNLICFIISLILLLALVIKLSNISISGIFSSNITKTIAALLLISIMIFQHARNRFGWLTQIASCKKLAWITLQLICVWFVCWLCLLILFVEPMMNAADKGKWLDLTYYVSFILNVFIFNSLAITLKTLKQKLQYFFIISIAIIASTSLLISINHGVNLIKAPFKLFNLGEISDARLVIKSEACKQVRLLEPSICVLTNNENFGVMPHVKIISRIGSEFIIHSQVAHQDFIFIKKQSSIAIKKEDVLTWEVSKN